MKSTLFLMASLFIGIQTSAEAMKIPQEKGEGTKTSNKIMFEEIPVKTIDKKDDNQEKLFPDFSDYEGKYFSEKLSDSIKSDLLNKLKQKTVNNKGEQSPQDIIKDTLFDMYLETLEKCTKERKTIKIMEEIDKEIKFDEIKREILEWYYETCKKQNTEDMHKKDPNYFKGSFQGSEMYFEMMDDNLNQYMTKITDKLESLEKLSFPNSSKKDRLKNLVAELEREIQEKISAGNDRISWCKLNNGRIPWCKLNDEYQKKYDELINKILRD